MNDGVALYSMAHPRPVWWKRPYWALCCWLPLRNLTEAGLTQQVNKMRRRHPGGLRVERAK